MTIIECPAFKSLFDQVVNQDGELGKILVSYLKDVSLFLSLIQSVRQSDIDLHLEAERKAIPLMKAYNHWNYFRYISYQHVHFNSLKNKNDPIYEHLKERGFGASYSGDTFSSVHGDLVTEYLNREMKGTSGPFRSGHSTSLEKRLKWINTAHIHAKLREQFKDTMRIKTTTVHKELTNAAKKQFNLDVNKLKSKLLSYGTMQSLDGPAKVISTGAEVSTEIVKSFFKAESVGEEGFQDFILRFVASDNNESTNLIIIFKPIKSSGIVSGLEKSTKGSKKASTAIEEDRQAFGELIAQHINLSTALSHPLTKYPLSIAEIDGKLRGGSKSTLRTLLVSPVYSDALSLEIDSRSSRHRVLYDGFALWRRFKPKATYKEWLIYISMKNQLENPNASQNEIINDHYLEESTKASTRASRGSPSTRIHLASLDQVMPQGKRWDDFFHNIKNKADLVQLALKFFKSIEGRSLLNIPLIFTCETQCYKITNDEVEAMPHLNYEEADSKIIFRVCEEDTPVLVRAKDADMFVLLVFARSLTQTKFEWIMQTDKHECIDIDKVYRYLGDDIARIFPQFHAITGCDTTSYKFRRGKRSVIKKLLKKKHLCHYLQNLGQDPELTEDVLSKALKFVQCCVYSGAPTETYLESRIRIYKNLEKKHHSSYHQMSILLWKTSRGVTYKF